MRDFHNATKPMRCIDPGALGATKNSRIIDKRGYRGVEFVIAYGAVAATGATITPVILEGDVTGTLTSAAAEDILGTETAAGAGIPAGTPRTSGVNQLVSKSIAYVGKKRYAQLRLVNTGVTSLVAGASALLFNPTNFPAV
jgi:hypothetical protein